jgi:hypothetical protein
MQTEFTSHKIQSFVQKNPSIKMKSIEGGALIMSGEAILCTIEEKNFPTRDEYFTYVALLQTLPQLCDVFLILDAQ